MWSPGVMFVYLLTVLVSYGTLVFGDGCHDIDTDACVLMHANNPDLCNDPALSETACPKYCNLCPLTCFHCDVAVHNVSECNTTRQCARGEKCMLRELKSSGDGHYEYAMSCSTVQLCDGGEMAFPFGRRDVRNLAISCCESDMCNSPLLSMTSTTTAATSMATTSQPVCTRDIYTLIEDARTTVAENSDQNIRAFLQSLVSNIDIGKDASLMEVATVDNSVNKQWGLHDHDTQDRLIQAIDSLDFNHDQNALDIQDIYKFVEHEATRSRHGDRHDVPNDLIIILDNRAQPHDVTQGINRIPYDISSLAGDVIVVSVGGPSPSSLMVALATDPTHVLHVSSYDQLSTIKDQLLSLLCS